MNKLLIMAFSVSLCACSGSAQLASNTAATVAAINTVNTSLVKVNQTVISDTVQLANSLAAVNCPVINATVALGTVVATSPTVASNIKTKLQAAGKAGALASDLCVAAGYTPNTQIGFATGN